ncbi:hypothetical protein Tco_1278530 [Tanacetum coccineum]
MDVFLGVVAANMVVVMATTEKPGGGVISLPLVMPEKKEDLDGDGEHGFDCLNFALVSSKAHREGCRDSRGGFPYMQPSRKWFYATRNYLKVIGCNWEKIPFGLQRGGLRNEEEGTSLIPHVYYSVIP